MRRCLLLWDNRSAHNRGPNEPNRSHFQSFFIVEKFAFFSPFFRTLKLKKTDWKSHVYTRIKVEIESVHPSRCTSWPAVGRFGKDNQFLWVSLVRMPKNGLPNSMGKMAKLKKKISFSHSATPRGQVARSKSRHCWVGISFVTKSIFLSLRQVGKIFFGLKIWLATCISCQYLNFVCLVQGLL